MPFACMLGVFVSWWFCRRRHPQLSPSITRPVRAHPGPPRFRVCDAAGHGRARDCRAAADAHATRTEV